MLGIMRLRRQFNIERGTARSTFAVAAVYDRRISLVGTDRRAVRRRARQPAREGFRSRALPVDRLHQDGSFVSRMKRRLAAILVGDVVGYSAMMEADEEGTASASPNCPRCSTKK